MMLRNVFARIQRVFIVAVTLGLVFAATPAVAAPSGTVYVVQGLPGRTVDIVVDGRTVAKKVPAASVVGPFKVAPGSRKVAAVAEGKTLLERGIKVSSGGNLDVVIHRPASPSGAPVVTTYANKLAAVPADKGAVRVAHTAAVGPADIRVDGKVLFENVANGESLELVVPAKTYSVEIVPTGATTPRILGPLPLPIKARSLTRVFAIGEPTSKTMNVAVHVLSLSKTGTGRPSRVDTGTGGQAMGLDDGAPVAPLVLCGLLAVALLLGVRRSVRR